MNRAIKFRGKSRFRIHEWLYGSLLLLNGKAYICPDKAVAWNMTRYEVILNTTGQFTGLLDKNGKEIYEHDLVECSGVLCEIVCNDKIGAFVLLEVLTQNLGNKPIGQMLDMFDIKYVGNIYDNPELIKEE